MSFSHWYLTSFPPGPSKFVPRVASVQLQITKPRVLREHWETHGVKYNSYSGECLIITIPTQLHDEMSTLVYGSCTQPDYKVSTHFQEYKEGAQGGSFLISKRPAVAIESSLGA